MTTLERLDSPGALTFDLGLGRFPDGARPLESLRELSDVWWAIYRDADGLRLHVSAGFELRLNGVVTGGGALQPGDVLDDGAGLWRLPRPSGPTSERLDVRALEAPDDDALALVYRDWALEHASPVAETLRRPVPLAEQARHLWSLTRLVATGHLEADFAGRHLRRLTLRTPTLELISFVDALARVLPDAPHLHTLRTAGLSTDDAVQLALLLARTDAARNLHTLECGNRGAFHLDDFRARDQLDPHHRAVENLSGPREGPARPITLELDAWDGWWALEPLTRDRHVRLDADTALHLLDDSSAALGAPSSSAVCTLRRLDDWVLEPAPGATAGPRWRALPLRASLGLLTQDQLELLPGLVVRVTPTRR